MKRFMCLGLVLGALELTHDRDQITTLEIELKLAELAAADDQFSYDQFLVTQKLDREAAERSRQQSRQKHDNYVKIDREQTIENSKYSVKSSQYR